MLMDADGDKNDALEEVKKLQEEIKRMEKSTDELSSLLQATETERVEANKKVK